MTDYVMLKMFRKNLTESYDILIDKEDFEKVSQGQWYGYMDRKNTHLKNIIRILWTIDHKGEKKKVYEIYQWILSTKHKDIIVDHKNMNRLDNRRKNLRFVTAQENRINQISTGWYYNKDNNTYSSNIYYNNQSFYLGEYETKEEAENIYLKACIFTGYSDVSEYHNSKIKEMNIVISKDDYINVYLNRIIGYMKTGDIIESQFQTDKNMQDNMRVANNSNLGYNYDKPTKKYLTRITLDGKGVNIGRYKTEIEANEIYLKACIISGNFKLFPSVVGRIERDNITVTEEDYKNKYLKKIYNIIHNIDEPMISGKINYGYEENMDIIIELVEKGYNWNKIATYLKQNIKGLQGAKGETVHKKYLIHMENLKLLNK